MTVTTDILRTWRGPRQVMRDLLAMGQREDRAIAYLLVACLLIFVAQWPRLARLSQGFDAVPGQDIPALDRLIAYEFMSWLMVWPLIFYAVAGLSHFVARLLGGRGSWFGARLALFWSLLATAPVALLYGVFVGFYGASAVSNVVGAVWIAAFVAIWLLCLREAES